MTTLHVELQDGFTGEPVVVEVDGATVVEDSPRTRVQIGLALTLEVDVEPGSHVLTVRHPGAAPFVEAVDVGAETWVGVSVAGGVVTARVQPAPFWYA
ncbi:conserved hypothetical protein [Xylanimonas cellulosilytica DSM 15894]|uniref:Uncharacterized protein n=1 Tax=Xylanimonas cellulosilytica (strain DSM 15894 / JCM 12276 / CECT 5975 / KCTC 9989 / LMG 20990 / NBRC 107835 / XIL07) TaxID=446471 RepID=D1BR76_XYLCX|nr:hypothetical protein [Xylanimonas cellulosilytica]ACZ30331.1 conserved hypothetical protein [Xylanimonas cellulosilytica DSM 15894]